MHAYQIKEMTDALIVTNLVSKKDEEKVKAALRSCWTDRIAVSWSVDDVIERAKELHKRVSKKKAREILERLLDNHDATLGITWDTIDYYIDN